MMYHDFDVDDIYSLDIETNQYYNYTTWADVDVYEEVHPDYEDAYTAICEAIATVAHRIPEDRLAGRDILIDAYNYYVSLWEDYALEEAKRQWDVLTGPDGILAVTAAHSEMYLCCITHIPYMLMGINKHTGQQTTIPVPLTDLTLDSYTDAVKNAERKYYYTAQEVGEALRKIYNAHSLKKCKGEHRALIVIHNLSYEVNNCLRNTSYMAEMVNAGLVSYLSNNANNSYKSMELNATYTRRIKGEDVTITYPAVYIRDTWKLTGKSIKALGKAHNYDKLDYDYDGIRMQEDLTQVDYDYNARDTEIALLGLYDAMCQYDTVPNIELRTIPVSQNNIVSNIAKHLFAKDYKMHKAAVTCKHGKAGVRYMDAELYASYKPTTGGGLVTINPQYAYNKYVVGETYNDTQIKGIYHIDLNSAHPSQVFKRLFPATAPQPVDDATIGNVLTVLKADINTAIAKCTPDAVAQDLDRFATLFPHLHIDNTNASGYATFTLSNVRAKSFTSCNETYNIPTIWGSKIVRKQSGRDEISADDTIIANAGSKLHGKIVESDQITITITFEDLCIFAMFNDFEITSARNMYLYKLQYCSPYLYNQFVYFGKKKNHYKRIVKACDKHLPVADIEALCDDPIVSAADRAVIVSTYKQDAEAGKHTAEALLKVVKAQFNGIYGCSYQSLYRDHRVLKYDDMHDTLVCEAPENEDAIQYDDANSSGIDILQGSYIAQWSRVDIAMNTLLAINCGAVPVYIATDSIYMLITQETRADIRDIYGVNKPFPERPYNKQTAGMAQHRPNEPQLGGMDFENDIQTLCYTQPLKIIAHEIGKTEPSITWSGITADKFFEGCNDIYERMMQEDAYVSRIDSNKSVKTDNNTDDAGYVLDTLAYLNNNTRDMGYLYNRAACIIWK